MRRDEAVHGGGRDANADQGRTADDASERDPDGFDVPPDADAMYCPRCGQPFARERHRALHLGLDHWDDLTEGEREAFEAARADERADLRRFRIVALGALVLVYFGFLFAYALAA